MVGYLIYHRCLQLQKHYNDVSHSNVKGQPHCDVIMFFNISFLCITQQSKSRKRDSKNIYICIFGQSAATSIFYGCHGYV